MVTKLCISSPLEAGRSILDAYNLPPRLCDALEHISNKLANKNINLKLVVALRDYQLPTFSIIPSHNVESGVYASQPPTPGSPYPALTSRFSHITLAFSSLKRLGNKPTALVTNFSSNVGHNMASPTSTVPYTPSTPMSPPPMSACTTTTFTTAADITGPYGACALGVRLVHTTRLHGKSKRTLQYILDKTRAKFDIGYDLLPQIAELEPNGAAPGGLTDSIIRRSIIQDEVLFVGKALTLIALDRCYTFKSALSSYSRIGSHTRLEDAVDELRRLYLANGSRKVSRTDIVRSYDWLSVSDQALRDVDMMYRRAYGGAEGFGAIEGLRKPSPNAVCTTNNSNISLNCIGMIEMERKVDVLGWATAQHDLERELDYAGDVSSGGLCWTESESDDDFDMPSWQEKDDIFHITDNYSTAVFSLKSNSSPRALNLPLQNSAPRVLPSVKRESFTPIQQTPISAPTIEALIRTIPTRPASTQPPPAPTSEKPPACILSKTPPPRSMTHSLPKLQIPPTKVLRSKSTAGVSPPQLKLQTTFAAKPLPSSGPSLLPVAHKNVPGTHVLPNSQDIVETPCTALPATTIASDFPNTGRGNNTAIDTTMSPTSAIAAKFYGMPLVVSTPSGGVTETPKTVHDTHAPLGWHHHASIAQMLSPIELRMSMQSVSGLGPMTPNVADDISPITRGEWGALFSGPTFSSARQVAITTCQASSLMA